MSKGGAGKVYFVLYLAVVLELLIIIVERDEAEEHLLQKQKETMKIVQSILSQLQSGSGTESINTRPQDEITIPPSGMNIKEIIGVDLKPYRKYIVEVGVVDVSAEATKKEGETPEEYLERLEKLVTQANVSDLEYQVFYNSSEDPSIVPQFPTKDYIEQENIDIGSFEPGQMIEYENYDEMWEFLGSQTLTLDEEQTYANVDKANAGADPMHPIYNEDIEMTGPSFAPNDVEEDSVFYYSAIESFRASGMDPNNYRGGFEKRAFVVNFQPPSKAGWYKLRFVSQNNRILGVRGEEPGNIDEESTVNIGTVQLKVKDLETVEKELERKLEKFEVPEGKMLLEPGGARKFDQQIEKAKQLAADEEDATDLQANIRLYGYIMKLLTPGQLFDQNRGDIEFNIRVTTPKPPVADPVVNIADEFNRFDKNKFNFRFSISPYRGDQNNIIGTVHDVTNPDGEPVARLDFKPVSDETPAQGGSVSYYATSDKPIPSGVDGPRRYLVKVKHQLQGKEEIGEAKLNVFPAIDEDKVRVMKVKIDALSYYGESLFFNYEPPSGNKIKPEQFGYYFKTDADAQDRGLTRGLAAAREDNLTFTADMTKGSLKIVWVDPITEEEVAIFPKYEFTVQQSEPGFSTINQQDNVSVDGELVRVRVTGISINPPRIGNPDSDKKASVDVSLDQPKVKVPGYSALGKPNITIKDGKATIDLTLTGEPDEDGNVKGVIELTGKATATNPLNGVKSKPRNIKISVQVRAKADSGGDDYYYEDY